MSRDFYPDHLSGLKETKSLEELSSLFCLIDILPDKGALLRRDLRQQSLLDNIEFGLKDVEALPG